MQRVDEADFCLHTVAGLLNYLGGSFTMETLEEKSFAEVIDTLIRNGAKISIGINDDRERTFKL